MHYEFIQEDFMKEIKTYSSPIKKSEAITKSMTQPMIPREILRYPNCSTITERMIREVATVKEQLINV